MRVDGGLKQQNKIGTETSMKSLKNSMLAVVAVAASGFVAFARQAFKQPDAIALGNTTANASGYRTFQATAAAIGLGKRVKVDSDGLISVASGTEGAVGVTVEAIAASGYGTVKLFNAGGTFIVCANGSVTRGSILYPAAGGNVDDTGNTALPLVALEAATAQGDLIEAAPWLLGAS